ncbi:MAG: hypothetical protein ACI8V2_000640 [Candidatus Latescibacterota bacterium]|jgi:hypothetical protein
MLQERRFEAHVKSDKELEEWVAEAVAFTETLPEK